MTTWSPRLDRRAHWLALAALVPATEWLRNPADGWVFLLGILALIALVAGVRAGRHGRVVVAAVIALAATLAAAERWVSRVEDQWPAERERRVAAAFQRLQGELHASLKRADKQAEFAVRWADGDRAAAFGELDRALPRGGVETAIAILDPAGMPWAWAGRHRLVPEADGDSITARFSRFYATIESRRHSPSGRVVVASVLVWADSAVPNPERSLAAQFGASAGVQLRVFPPGTAQRGGDIFDYSLMAEGLGKFGFDFACSVLVPTFNDPKDRVALGILGELFRDRPVVGIHALELVWGLGTLHCLSQQEPALPERTHTVAAAG